MTEDLFKGWFHAGLAVIFGVALGYNVMRVCVTKKRRNAVNVGVYATAMAWELVQVQRHWRPPARPAETPTPHETHGA